MEQALARPASRPAQNERLEALEREHGQALFGFVRRLGLADVEAMDVVQELFLRLHRQLGAGPITNDRGWAYRTVYRLAMDQHRSRRRHLALVDRLSGPDLPTGISSDDRIAVWSAVDRLPVRQRAVVYLRYHADLPYEEVGRILGITASAARSHAAQAMTALRRELGPEETST